MNKQELKQILHEIAAQSIPSDRDMWPIIRQRLNAQPDRRQYPTLFAANRLGLGRLGLVLAALFIFSIITAYAAAPWISRLLERDERLQHIDWSLSQPLNLSQTIGNVTVTVEWAYADADWILVGYTIRASDGKRFDPLQTTLKDRGGVALPWQGTYGVTGQSDILKLALPIGEGMYVAIFDNVSTSRVLDVQFEISVQELVLPSTRAPAPDEDGTGTTVAVIEPLPAGRTTGPFTFDFKVNVASSSQSR